MSIWQTKSWGKMLLESNQADKIFEIDGIKIEKRRVSMGEFGLFVLGIESDISEKSVKEMIELCKKEKALFIQIETINYTSPQPSPSEERGQVQKNVTSFSFKGEGIQGGGFNTGYYKKFITPYTAVINLDNTEDEILALMKPKGRYNIKLATKKGVEVESVSKTDENIKEFYDLMIETTSRDNFNGNKFEFYKTFLSLLDNSELLLAKVDSKTIAAGIFTFKDKESFYYYGASISDKAYRNLMAPYLLQWEAIKIAKKSGSKLYDFLGIASPGDKKSDLAGVTDFKLKLSKDSRKVSESFIFINKNFKYLIIKLLRKLKR